MNSVTIAKVLIVGTLAVTLNIIIVSRFLGDLPWFKGWQQNESLVNSGNESFASILTGLAPVSTKGETRRHRTYLISQTRCTQKVILLIMVFTAPANFDRRKVIRKTWATDPSAKIRWKTVFLLGQAVGDNIMNEYLEAEGKIHRDLIRGAQKEHYDNLTLKTQMGLEWASKYCDFEFLLKADDDVFVNPFKLLDYLGMPVTPKTKLYTGACRRPGSRPRRGGKYGVSWEEYNKTTYPAFCNGPAYLLSSDLVHKLVEMFDVNKKPLRLEDVYIGMLVEKMGDVNAVKHPWFRGYSGQCNLAPDTISQHRVSVQCMEELFNLAMKERVEYELARIKSVKTGSENTLNITGR